MQKDTDLLEKVQKRATRLMIKYRNLSYSERLKRLNITTLETRRLRGYLIQVFKFSKVSIISITVISLLWRVQS